MSNEQCLIAAWLERPSVYMSGPSEHSMNRAQDLIEFLEINGFEIKEVK